MSNGWYRVVSGREERIVYVERDQTEIGSVQHLLDSGFILEQVKVLTQSEYQQLLTDLSNSSHKQ